MPRGASAPPKTFTVGSTAFSAWYVRERSDEVGGRGGVGPVRVELRQPEPVEVRLVADDEVLEVGHLRGELGGVLREARLRVGA